MPKILLRCVRKLKRKGIKNPYPICIASLKKAGIITKKNKHYILTKKSKSHKR